MPLIAPSGLAIYTGDRFPKWRESLFIGAVADRSVGKQLYRVDLSVSPPHQESMLAPLGHRIRDPLEPLESLEPLEPLVPPGVEHGSGGWLL